jgi:hypothetical protein
MSTQDERVEGYTTPPTPTPDVFTRLVQYRPHDVIIRRRYTGDDRVLVYEVWHVMCRNRETHKPICWEPLYTDIPTLSEAAMQKENALYYATMQRAQHQADRQRFEKRQRASEGA